MGGMDAAAAHLVCAKQDIVDALAPLCGGKMERDIFKISARGCKDDPDFLVQPIG